MTYNNIMCATRYTEYIKKRTRCMINAGIIGSTGYAGQELVKLLLMHKGVNIAWYGSRSYAGQSFSEVYGNMRGFTDDICQDEDIDRIADECDVIFTATPQGMCSGIVNEDILSKTKIIDLSADFRIKDVDRYEEWYGLKHGSPEFIHEAVYGLTEINREDIRTARLLANPGCFPTCSVLALYPLVREGYIDANTIIIDAKSGTSGAGRGAKVPNLYCEVNESIKAYGISVHRHTPEIEDQLAYALGDSVTINFTPHLVPMNRGILAVSYANMIRKAGYDEVRAVYDRYYGDEYFIRLLDDGTYPETRWVEGSNYTDIGFHIDKRTGRMIAVSAIDNLVKGAAGQAVQNMNVMFGLDEKEGLRLVPAFP